MKRGVYIGFDTRQADAFAVAKNSTRRRSNSPIPVRGLVLNYLRRCGLYTRPHEMKDGRMWCPISEAPISTEFANSRFLTPILAAEGLALFMDSDMLVRTDLSRLFDMCEAQKDKYAMWCVKHDHVPENSTKMDNQAQTRYPRKNWSSVMVFNCDHEANKALTLDMVNSVPGRELHRFCWLGKDDDLIGELDVSYNWLVGHSPEGVEPRIVHYTDGVPSMPGYENSPYADEWWAELWGWAWGHSFPVVKR